MAELNSLKKRILRSLCANTKEEEQSALENFGKTSFTSLNFEGVFQQTLEIILQFIQHKSGPPQVDSVVDFAERNKLREIVSFAREISVLSLDWGPSYVDLLDQYKEEVSKQKIKTLLLEVSQITEDGLQDNPKEKALVGVSDAVYHMIQGGVEIHQYLSGNNRSISSTDAEAALETVFLKKKEQVNTVCGATGHASIDEATGGGHPGELWFVGGYAKHNKTTLALNWCHNLAYEGGWNIYFVTLEMPSEDIWEILYTIHSAHPKWGRPPLKHKEIQRGRFSNPEDETFYRGRVKPDLNPDKSFGVGNIIVERPTGSMTVQSIRARAETLNRVSPLDLVVVDYLMLLDAPKGYSGRGLREIMTENIKQMKNMTLEFDRGSGIWVVVPHQLSRDGLKEATKNNGEYTTSAFAETAEVERSADQLFTIFLGDEFRSRREAKICHLLNRKGECAKPYVAYAPLEHRLIREMKMPTGAELLRP